MTVLLQDIPLLLLIAVASVVFHSSFGEGSPRPSSEIGNDRQPKQFFPIGFLQHPYQPDSGIYNRHYMRPQSDQLIGPFFGYFPNLFPAPSVATTTTTTTTTTEKPVPLTTCSKIATSSTICPACKDITPAGGTFQSPNYPLDYGYGFECSYAIKVATGKKVKVTLTGGYQFDNGRSDNLEVFNGDQAVSTNNIFSRYPMNPISGSSDKILATSSGNTITIRFSMVGTGNSAFSPCKYEVKYAEVA